MLSVTALVGWIILFAFQSQSSPISFLPYALGGGTAGAVKRPHCPSGFWPVWLEMRQEREREEFTLSAHTPQPLRLAEWLTSSGAT